MANTGNALVDTLQGLQITLHGIDSPDEKINRFKQGVQLTRATDLVRSQFLISAQEVWATDPTMTEQELLHIQNDLMFIGKVAHLGYHLDPDVPIDAMTIAIEHPEVWGVSNDEAALLSMMDFHVPILSIDSVTSANLG